MAVPGVYTKAEQKMLKMWEEVEQNVGWLGDEPIMGKVTYPVYNRTVTREFIIQRANAIQDPNPLFRDEKYAAHTRWGSIIAPPFYENVIAQQGWLNTRIVPPEIGFAKALDAVPQFPYHVLWTVYPHWEFFKPIREDDKFKIWCGPNTHQDITNPDGKGRRRFCILDHLKFINQKNELVAIKYKSQRFEFIYPEAGKKEEDYIEPLGKNLGEYKYTQAELDYIDRVLDEEIILGSQIRWWDDVKVGDDLQPVISGPVTLWLNALDVAGLGVTHVEGKRSTIPPHVPIQDPETGVYHKGIEGHFVDKIARLQHLPQTTTIMTQWENVMGRIITNWMGDDGFIKRTAFDHLVNDFLGDTVVCRGKVIGKNILDDGEHVVEIACWLENMRGYITKAGTATVSLYSRETVDKDILRY
jgi:hypothetical protein